MVTPQSATQCLLDVYSRLAEGNRHLFQGILQGRQPVEWDHYPENDAVDRLNGYQWFYHTHSATDRPGVTEHGHLHLFAKRKLWSHRLRSQAETAFCNIAGAAPVKAATAHLLAISFDAKGLPVGLFTVNSQVTGDRILNALLTEELISKVKLDTGFPEVDRVIECLARLCNADIRQLLAERDAAVGNSRKKLSAEVAEIEVLSEINIDLDSRL